MSEVSKVSSKGLTTVPLEIRRKLRIEEGDFLEWSVEGDRAIVRVLRNPYRFLRGRHRDPELTFEKIEELADRLIEGEVIADSRARSANSAGESRG